MVISSYTTHRTTEEKLPSSQKSFGVIKANTSLEKEITAFYFTSKGLVG